MSIDWHALLTVLAVTLVSTVGLVGVFTLGIVGLSRRAAGPAAALGRTGAWVCFAACAAAVVWGIYLIVQK
ncbi:hypothetical protein [Actinacidiphila rubida]|uniref:Uncharacterized protein n=1 Tax=Actinacidiphila rubida TaxID=310780 RepID=A0A1H8SBS9_9ACTN|nr:hypothetical protein [Actinacidiphila rubida]SEO75653.1 hypothetical protein SAMN05216267_104055 [Actinacidiphila rubida]